jgi:hypothetical protein
VNKIVLWNSPAKTGKDVAIKYLQGQGIPLRYAECKDKLHKLVQEMFCISEERYWEIYNDRSLKEVALDSFKVMLSEEEGNKLEKVLGYSFGNYYLDKNADNRGGSRGYFNLSIREAMIYVSEVLIKPRFGKDYYGQARVKYMQSSGEGIWTDGSAAFVEELYPLIKYLGQDNILLIRVHREGYNFDGDSRNYIPDGVIANTVDVSNNGTEQEYFHKVEKIVREFLYG